MTMFKRMAAALLGLLALLALFLLASRFWPASAQQQQARAALEQLLDWPGDNAWAALMTLNRPGLDAARQQTLVDAHVAAFSVWAQQTASQRYGEQTSSAAVPEPPAMPGGEPAGFERSPLLCASNEAAQCLHKVRRAPQAVAEALTQRQRGLDNVAGLALYGHARNLYQADLQTPYPPVQWLLDPLSAHALAHVQGNSGLALAGLCRDMGTGRMLMSHSDSLIVAMAGQRMLEANGQLLAEVLAELPSDHPLPATCTAAVAPLDVPAMSLCTPMRGEYAMSRAVMAESYRHGAGSKPAGSWLFNVDKTLNRNAASVGQGCLAPVREQLEQDLPITVDQVNNSLWKMECPANAIGCILSAVAGPAYGKYHRRTLDTGASQRLLGALVWLRGQPQQGGIEQYLEALPAELVSQQRPITLSADGRHLQMTRYQLDGDTPLLQLPLPPVWWPQPPAEGPALP